MARGDAMLAPAVTRRLIAAFVGRAGGPPVAAEARLAALTQREREVVTLVAAGLSNEEIGVRLRMSPATAKTHVNRAMAKLGARDRAQLVVFAYQSGLAGTAAAGVSAARLRLGYRVRGTRADRVGGWSGRRSTHSVDWHDYFTSVTGTARPYRRVAGVGLLLGPALGFVGTFFWQDDGVQGIYAAVFTMLSTPGLAGRPDRRSSGRSRHGCRATPRRPAAGRLRDDRRGGVRGAGHGRGTASACRTARRYACSRRTRSPRRWCSGSPARSFRSACSSSARC